MLKRHKQNNEQGAILLEALLAVVILSVGLTGMIQAMMSGLRSGMASADYIQVNGLINQVMVEQVLSGNIHNDGPAPSLDGASDVGGPAVLDGPVDLSGSVGLDGPIRSGQFAMPWERYAYAVRNIGTSDGKNAYADLKLRTIEGSVTWPSGKAAAHALTVTLIMPPMSVIQKPRTVL